MQSIFSDAVYFFYYYYYQSEGVVIFHISMLSNGRGVFSSEAVHILILLSTLYHCLSWEFSYCMVTQPLELKAAGANMYTRSSMGKVEFASGTD